MREDQADIKTLVQKRVHHLYYDLDKNCAKITLLCLGELLNFTIEPQVLQAATGLHGAGFLRCRELRPDGFNQSDPPHLCENLTAKTICFAWNFIRENTRPSTDNPFK